MSSYKPKSLDELNSMYDKALSAQRAIKRGTSKINETNSSNSFFEDVIKEAELSVNTEPEKPIADLSVAVDDFIKHFSEPKKEDAVPAAPQNKQSKEKAPQSQKTTSVPKVQTERKAAPITASPVSATPVIARKQSSEHISSLMSDYIKIMNDQDDSDEDETKHKKSFLSRKKEKKQASKESFKEEEPIKEDTFEEPSYTPLSDELKEEVFPFEKESVPYEEPEEGNSASAASEEAFNAFSAMSEKKESFHKEVTKNAEAETEEESEAEELPDSEEAEEEDKIQELSDVEEDEEDDENEDFTDLSSYSDDEETEETDEDEESDDAEEAEDVNAIRPYSKGKNALRVTSRVILSFICAITILLSLSAASLSTVFNVNTGKEAPGGYYFFTSSHNFFASGVKEGDLVICKKQITVSDDETAVYIDLENKTFSFGIKEGSKTNGDGDIIYLISDNEVDRDDVLGTVYKTVPALGDVIAFVYEHFVIVITALVSLSAILLLVVIFALKKRKFPEFAEAQEETETEEEYEEIPSDSEEEDTYDTDIFADLD